MYKRTKNINIRLLIRKIVPLVIIMGIYFNIPLYSQDVHFSQFYATPILTNPAVTGMHTDNFRVANSFRNQWGKIGVPFRTFYSSIDTRMTIKDQWFGIGALLVHDQSGAYNLAANEILLSLSFSKIVNNHQFSIGIQPGFAYRSFNLNGMTFGTQFDPANLVFNPGLPSSETNLAENLHYFDLNMGVYWRTNYKNLMPMVGFSVSHLIKPIVTFSSTDKTTRLPMKINVHGQVHMPLNQKFDITPSILYSTVPGTSEFLFGSLGGYLINDFIIPVKKVYGMAFLRLNPFRNIDAFIVGGGVKFLTFDFGVSYDINVSPLAKSSFFNGAFELSLIYTGGKPKKRNNEPCYIY